MQRAIALLVGSVVLANGVTTRVQAHDRNIAAGLRGGNQADGTRRFRSASGLARNWTPVWHDRLGQLRRRAGPAIGRQLSLGRWPSRRIFLTAGMPFWSGPFRVMFLG